MDVVKVIFLGARGVGKTSIIRQFVWNHFGDEHGPTETKRVYYSSAIFDDRVYQLRIADVPSISHFPVDSYVEWSDFRCYGLRNANAYILVFDLSDLETFRYVRVLREQIAESRDIKDVPILVVGNKHDSVSGLRHTHLGFPAGNSHPLTSKRGEAHKEKLKEIVALIRKQWKCSYVDCSAKYNWKVVAVFEEMIKIVDGVRPPSVVAAAADKSRRSSLKARTSLAGPSAAASRDPSRRMGDRTRHVHPPSSTSPLLPSSHPGTRQPPAHSLSAPAASP